MQYLEPLFELPQEIAATWLEAQEAAAEPDSIDIEDIPMNP